MDAAATAAWIAAAIAGGAAFIALAAANYSRRQAGAAEDQAKAAHDQVTLLSKQIKMAEQDRHEQNAPQFTITYSPSFGYKEDASWHTIVCTSGPSLLDKVTISPAPGSEVDGVGIDVDEQNKRSSIELRSVICGVERKFGVWLNEDDTGVVFLVNAETAVGTWESIAVIATDDY